MIINTVYIKVEECYRNVCEIIWDLVVTDGVPASEMNYLLDGLKTPEDLLNLVTKEGGLPSILPMNIMDFEVAQENGGETILVFSKFDKPFATVLFSQCPY